MGRTDQSTRGARGTGLYFAYGSNLKLARMRSRVSSARVRGPVRLAGHVLTLDKRGGDGSGKANLSRNRESWVWGALYEIDGAHWPRLDDFEPDYLRVSVEVIDLGGGSHAAQTYLSAERTADAVAFAWYKRLMIEGAREHGLPESWVTLLERLPERDESSDE